MSDIDKMVKYLKAELRSIVHHRSRMELSPIRTWTSKAAKMEVVASLSHQEMLLYHALEHAKEIKEGKI